MTVPIGERVAALESSIGEFHRTTDATLQKLAEGQDAIGGEARAASKDTHLVVTAAEKAAATAERAHAQELIIGEHVKELQVDTAAIQAQIKDLSLNGHGAQFAELIQGLPILLPWLKRQNDLAARQRLRESSGWWWVTGWALKLAVPAAAGSGLYALISALLH
jgi:hypothetical protein